MEYQWSKTPCGSRAPSRYHGENEDEYYEYEYEEEEGDDAFLQTEDGPYVNSENALYQEYTLASGNTLPPGVSFTSKIPPQLNGTTSWFSYEENVRDWVAMTEIPSNKQGPLLKLSLIHI